MASLWLNNGAVVIKDGAAVLCDDCPCGQKYYCLEKRCFDSSAYLAAKGDWPAQIKIKFYFPWRVDVLMTHQGDGYYGKFDPDGFMGYCDLANPQAPAWLSLAGYSGTLPASTTQCYELTYDEQTEEEIRTPVANPSAGERYFDAYADFCTNCAGGLKPLCMLFQFDTPYCNVLDENYNLREFRWYDMPADRNVFEIDMLLSAEDARRYIVATRKCSDHEEPCWITIAEHASLAECERECLACQPVRLQDLPATLTLTASITPEDPDYDCGAIPVFTDTMTLDLSDPDNPEYVGAKSSLGGGGRGGAWWLSWAEDVSADLHHEGMFSVCFDANQAPAGMAHDPRYGDAQGYADIVCNGQYSSTLTVSVRLD